MLQLLKFLPKLLFDQKLKFVIGLLMLIVQALKDVNNGQDHSKAMDAVIGKAYPLLPADLQATASIAEVLKVAGLAADLLKAVTALFKK